MRGYERIHRSLLAVALFATASLTLLMDLEAKEPMKHSIFYGITEAELDDPRLLEQGLADVASRGFDGINIDYRNLRTGSTSARLRSALQVACVKAKELGLGVIADGSYARMAETMKTEAPDLFTDALLPCRVTIKNGQFTLTFSDKIEYRSIERCWLIEKIATDGTISLRELTSKIRQVAAVTEGGGCAMTEVKGRAVARVTYHVEGIEQGEVFVVSRRRYDNTYFDLSRPELRHYTQRWLSHYEGLSLSGLAWDEPHFGFAFWPDNGRAISDNLYALFHKRFGYDLRDRLADLWWDQPGARSALTRLHFAELLEQSLADLESDFARQANVRLAGVTDAFIGEHRTMHEETGDDFFIGCSDYFRHNRSTSCGFTDSVFEREDSMVTMLQLSRNLAAANNGPAWNNSWGFLPTEAHHAYYLRLMGAMKIRWLGHMYHNSHMFGPGYPHHPLWATMKDHLTAHDQLFDALEGAEPIADTAVLYNWRAMASFPGNQYLHVHRRGLLLLGKALTYSQVQFQIVDETQLQCKESWRRVIVPWPDLLPPGVLSSLEKLSRRGAEVLFFGPPARLDSEGSSQAASFAKLCGIDDNTAPQELAMKEGDALESNGRSWPLAPLTLEPNYRSNERGSYPDHFKAYRLVPAPGAEIIATLQGKPVAVRQGRVTYFATEWSHFAGLPENWLGESPEASKLQGLVLLAYRRGDEKLLAGVARQAKPITDKMDAFGFQLRLENCTAFVVSKKGDQVTVLFAEGKVEPHKAPSKQTF